METTNSVAMATMNGELHPAPTQSDSTSSLNPAKRKRVSASDDEICGGSDSQCSLIEISRKEQLGQTLKDLLQILRKYDSGLGLLKRTIPSHSAVEPDSKRAKLSGDVNGTTSIESRILSGQYNSLQELIDDVETVSALVIEQSQPSNTLTNGFRSSESPPIELVNRTRVFKRHLDNFVLRSPFRDSSLIKPEFHTTQGLPAGQDIMNTNPREDRMILTLFGNAPRGKHLFSSLQQQASANIRTRESIVLSDAGIQAPLNEAALPSGIATSKIVPFNPLTFEEDKKGIRTLGELFSPRAPLPQLEIPRKGKSSTNGASVVTWIDPYEAATSVKAMPGERRHHSYSSLPSGHWLYYGYETSSTRNKNRPRKQSAQPQNDRNSGSQAENPLQQDDNALFSGIYSSFAPSFDSSGATVSEDAKHQVWWSKSGAKRLRAILSLVNDSEDESTGQVAGGFTSGFYELDEDTLEDAVNSFVPETNSELPSESQAKDSNGGQNDKELDEILMDISELLKTLNSYHHIRCLSVPVPAHAPAGKQPNELSTAVESSASPCPSEIEVYERLKASLSAMIAILPPYAVSKLNGEQLGELNVTKKILLENADYPGTMEEDECIIQQKQAARVASGTSATRTPTPIINANRSAPYQTPPTATSAPFQRAYPSNSRGKQAPANYQSPQVYNSRPGSSIHYQASKPPQNYPPSRQPPPPRAGYVQPQFSQPATSQYSQSGILQQFQRPGQNGFAHYPSQRGPSPSQNSPQAYQHRPAQPNYQQRVQESGYNTPVAGARSASPQKPSSFGTSPQRATYMNSTPSAAPPRFSQQQTPQPPHYQTFPSNQATSTSNTYPNAAVAMTYPRSAAEQAALMDRNKAQLAGQQRQKSGTPQPALTNTQPVGQENILPPGSRPNGTSIAAAASTR